MFDLVQKLSSIQAHAKDAGVSAVLIQTKATKRWLGLPSGSGIAVLVSKNLQALLYDGRYTQECEAYTGQFELIELKSQSKSARWTSLHELADDMNLKTIGFESDALSASLYLNLQKLGITATPLDFFAELRMIKTDEELSRLKKVCELTDIVFQEVCNKLKVGMTEHEVSALIHYYSFLHGAEKMSFEPIVSSGPRTALPHGRPTDRVISAGEPIMIDFGFQIYGMQSDMTRNVVLGEAPSKAYLEHYETLLEAQELGVSLIQSGISSEIVDARVREKLKESHLDSYFTHGLGHGVGIDCEDELPLLRPGSNFILKDHMAMSCEPGIYFPDAYGIRIEDDVAIEDGVGKPLNKTSKQLLILEG